MENKSSHVNKTIEKPCSPIGNRLREERVRLELSQADAALVTGVTREMWGRYERGAMPNAEVLLKAMGAGFDVNYILGGSRFLNESSESRLTDNERRLIEHFRKVDEQGQSTIFRVAENEARVYKKK